jgi:hypothetical protein
MMQLDLIESLHFHKLKDGPYDRRWAIVTIRLKSVPNETYALRSGCEIVQKVICLLGSSFNDMSDPRYGQGYTAHIEGFGEQNDCWITAHSFEPLITVRHKYWSDHQIAAFKRILRTLAGLHGWTVTEDE